MIGHEVVGGFEHARRRRRRNVDCERSVVRDRLDTARGLGRHSLLRRCRLEWASGACRLRNRDWRRHGHRCGCSRRRGARRLRFNGRRRRFRHSSQLGRSGRRFGRRGRLGRDRRGRRLGCSSRRRRLFGNSLFRGGSDVARRSDDRRGRAAACASRTRSGGCNRRDGRGAGNRRRASRPGRPAAGRAHRRAHRRPPRRGRCTARRPIAIVLPPPGTEPAKVTVPSAGACTSVPSAAPMSIPRCWPPAYGCAGSKAKGRSTGPSTGHVHARADAGRARTQSSTTANRRMENLLRCQNGERDRRYRRGSPLSILATKYGGRARSETHR